MPFQPPPVQPDFEKLRYVISSSKAAVSDRALTQVLYGLLDQLKKFQSITVDDIADINNDIEAIDEIINNINVLIASLTGATYITTDDETGTLPNSVQLLPGTNITFDDSVPNERTINATGGGGDELPVGTVYSTYVNVNAGTLLGYGTWLLFATGVGGVGTDITFTVY